MRCFSPDAHDAKGVIFMMELNYPSPGAVAKGNQPRAQSVFEKWFAGSAGEPPVPSGDSPDGTGTTVRANGEPSFRDAPVGGSPTGAGGSLRVSRATPF